MTTKKKIELLLTELVELGPVLPGGISKVFNVCGKATCRCKDKNNPQKHGPYNLLSYTIAGKSSSKFVKKQDLTQTETMLANHQRLKEICQELPVAYMELYKKEGIQATIDLNDSLKLKFQGANLTEKRLLHKISGLKKQVAQWKRKATERAKTINTLKSVIVQLKKSRSFLEKKVRSQEREQDTTDQKKSTENQT